MVEFIPGLRLCEMFYHEVVKPLIETEYPKLRYSAGLIDYGSEVLGFDTERSTDHHWGPRVQLFLAPQDTGQQQQIADFLSRNLPPTFRGYSTHFGEHDAHGVQLLTEAHAGQPINHRIEIDTAAAFFKRYLSIDLAADLTVFDWLTLSEQRLRTIRSGNIFHDQLGLTDIQHKLHYYPRDVWLYMLAAEWTKIGQEEPFVGRCGEVGDELGSRLIAARLVQAIMRLGFLMEKQYVPYSKWFGTAFSQLHCAPELAPLLDHVLAAKDWTARENYLSQAFAVITRLHNDLKLTPPLATEVSPFHDRPFLVIHGDVFADALRQQINDPVVQNIAADIGSVNQLTNSVDLLENNTVLKKLSIVYQ